MKINDDYLAILQDMFAEHDLMVHYSYYNIAHKTNSDLDYEIHTFVVYKKVENSESYEEVDIMRFDAGNPEDLIDSITKWIKK